MIKLFFIFAIGWAVWFFVFSDAGHDFFRDASDYSFNREASEQSLEQKKLELYRQKEILEKKISDLTEEAKAKRDEGLDRIDEIEESLEEAQQSYEDIIYSLHRFQRALDFSKPLEEQENEMEE